jgi:sensor histidine kinase YesM
MACCDINTPTGGILCYDNKNLVDITKELKLTSTQFWCLYYDTITEQLWAGSTDQGVFVVNLNNSILESNPLLFQKIKPEINSMCMDNKGNLFLGGNNFIAQKKGGKSICLSSNQIKKKVLAFISAHHSKIRVSDKDFIAQSNTFVCNCIKCDNDGKIWAITNYGLIKFNEKFEIENYVYINETNGVFEFFDQNKMLLSQFYNSSYGINFNSDIETSILKYKHHSINLNANKISKGKNHLWISTISKGLFLFENGILLSMHDLGFLNDKNTSEVIEDDQNNVITGTFSGKVFFSKWINRKLIHNRVLKPEIDIIGSTIFFIRKYKKYYLIGTNKGINIIRNYKLIKFLNKEENLIQTQYTDAIIDFKQKKLIVSSYKGLMEIDLESVLSSKKVNSPIQIKQIKINDKIIATADKIELSYDQNNIDIQFGSNNIYNPSKNRYSYKIIGLSNKWSEYNSETNLKLFNLDYGKYTILVRGKNIGTNEKIRSAILNITILPPFWKTAWFVILNVILISTLTFLYINRKIRQIQEKANIDKRIAETKLQALQSQMNPHFVFNAMNSIQNFVIDNQTDDALWYIGEFSKMMRQTLNFSSRKSVRLEEEIEYLRRYVDLENLRRNNSVIYKIIVDENIDQNEIEMPPMLIQPIVENVFVHAFDSSILKPMLTIEIHLRDENLLCVIKDNGKGLDLNKANPSNSQGIRLTEERINLIEANELKNVVVESIPAGGTCVSLSIPVR